MKKVVLFFAAVAAISLASCGGNAETSAPAVDSVAAEVVDTVAAVVDTVVADSAATDSVAVDSVAADSAK